MVAQEAASPAASSFFKRRSSTQMVKKTVLKHLTGARLGGGTFAQDVKSQSRAKDAHHAANFYSVDGMKHHVITWKRNCGFEQLKEQVCAKFGLADVELFDAEARLPINSDSELRLVADDFAERDDARAQDVLSTWVVMAQTQLATSEPDVALHQLWEIACRPENHEHIDGELIGQLVGAMLEHAGAEPAAHRVAALAASALWMLCESEPTRARMPLPALVPALLRTAAVVSGQREAGGPCGAGGRADLSLQPVGALSALLHLPETVAIFEDAEEGLPILISLLTSESSRVRRALLALLHPLTFLRRVPAISPPASPSRVTVVSPSQVRRVACSVLFRLSTLSQRTCVRLVADNDILHLADVACSKVKPSRVTARV